MKLFELHSMIADHGCGDGIEVVINVESNQSVKESIVELRDIGSKTVLQIRHYNYGSPVGFPHLTGAELAKQRMAFLDGLEDVNRLNKGATRKYTNIHGDHRIYRDLNGINDTCYGKAFDPRVVDGLVADGLVIIRPNAAMGLLECVITAKGRDTLMRI